MIIGNAALLFAKCTSLQVSSLFTSLHCLPEQFICLQKNAFSSSAEALHNLFTIHFSSLLSCYPIPPTSPHRDQHFMCYSQEIISNCLCFFFILQCIGSYYFFQPNIFLTFLVKLTLLQFFRIAEEEGVFSTPQYQFFSSVRL